MVVHETDTETQKEEPVPHHPTPDPSAELLAQLHHRKTEKEEKKMTTQDLPDHLSYSQINTYMTCPLRYRFQYVEEIEPQFVSAGLAFGSAIHEAAAAFNQTHLEGDSLRADQMLDVYRQAWQSREEDARFFNGDDAQSLENKAQQMLTAFAQAHDPSTTVIGVEERFQVEFNGLPPFVGFIDLIEQPNGGPVCIVDLKTAARKPTDFQIHNNMQLTAYSTGAGALGFDTRNLKLRLDELTKTKKPEMVRYETMRTERNQERFVKLVDKVWNAIQRDCWFPRENWHCAQYAYQEHCKNW
ncbi:RecB family exonuclease [Thermodesulfobacteriota bacterium]